MFTIGAKLYEEEYSFKNNKKQQDNNFSKTIIPKNEHQLVFTFEKRRGKPVTLVGRFNLSDNEKKEILKLLKTSLGCGGSIKEEWIELQGNNKNQITSILEAKGWKFKKK